MKPSNGKTVWQHAEKKWKPRNFQAVKVMFPAHGMHHPPEEVKEPVFAETQAERFARESKARDGRLKKIAAESTERDLANDAKRKAQETKRWRRKLSRFKIKQAAKIERVVAKKAEQVATGARPSRIV